LGLSSHQFGQWIWQAAARCSSKGACVHGMFYSSAQLRRRRSGKQPMTAPPSPARLGVGGDALLRPPLMPLLPMPVGTLLGAHLGTPARLAARARVASECRPRAQSKSANQGCCRTSSAPACAPRRCVGSCGGR
jgi:hypothetical protein